MAIHTIRTTIKCHSVKFVRKPGGTYTAICHMSSSNPSVQLGEIVIEGLDRPGQFAEKYPAALEAFVAKLPGQTFLMDIKV